MITTTDVPLNSELGILRFRATHSKFPQPTQQQESKFLDDVATFLKQKFSRDEAINLAFSLIHWYQ